MATTFAKASFARALLNAPYSYQDDTSLITLEQVPQEFRAPGIGLQFAEAANDPFVKSRGTRLYEPDALWNEVTRMGGKVDAETARQFVNDHLSGVFANDANIKDPLARKGLKDLGFETVISLYESVAKSDAKGNSLYLRELNRALDLPDSFYQQRVAPIGKLLDDSNKNWMEAKWQEALKDGRLASHSGSFADAMAEELNSPPMWNASDARRRIEMLQFMADAYSDFLGETRIKVGLFKGQPGLKGFYMHETDENDEVIGLNVMELGNFQACIGVILHERQHGSQQRLADAYKAGHITKGHKDYVAARVFAANGGDGGYINGGKDAGMNGYRFQPMEQDAHNAGSLAEYMAFKTYARKPGIYTERHVKPDNSPVKLAA
ncbi:MAG: hypothetical protein ACK4NR_04750 [Micavibrio sp.]